MFCDEPVKSVRYLQQEPGEDYLSFIFSPEYYAAAGKWLVLETEHHAVTLGTDGVRILPSAEQRSLMEQGLHEDDDFDDDDIVLSEESLYFIGERIRAVSATASGWRVSFDHFELGLFPVEKEDDRDLWSWERNFIPYPHLSHKLRPCVCGGEAELMMGQVSDYFIRCGKCRRSTYADYRLRPLIDAWNAGNCPVHQDYTPFENLVACASQRITGFCISFRNERIGKDHLICQSLMIQCEKTAYELESLFLPHDTNVLNVTHELSGFNRARWPESIALEADEIARLQSGEQKSPCETMRFTTGKRDIIVTAWRGWLDLRIVNRAEGRSDQIRSRP